MTSRTARFDSAVCTDRARALATEWLETDGVGGFAMGTVDGQPTRRYHGLLIAVPRGQAKRHLFLSGFAERVIPATGQAFGLSPLSVSDPEPIALAALTAFALDPAPTATFGFDGVTLTREVVMPKGRAAVLCRYALSAASPAVRLELGPRLACRDVDQLHFRNDALDPGATFGDGVLVVRPYASLPAVVFRIEARPGSVDFVARPHWESGVEYPVERARGYDGREDLFVPGVVQVDLRAGEAVTITVALEQAVDHPQSLLKRVLALRGKARRLRGAATADSAVRARLDARADDFLQIVHGRLGICAGYPWFGEWGRDTCIALPGLTLARGRVDQCGKILRGIVDFLRDGLVPNIFGRTPDDSHYGSVDAALWFGRAVDLWRRADGRHPDLDPALDRALLEIARCYHDGEGKAGSSLAIRADDDGLLTCGDAGLNATWMDARLPTGPVTPRDGKPVEIEALWCSLLDAVAALPGADPIWIARRDLAFRSFVDAFWLEDPARLGGGRLADRVTTRGEPDPRVRPNMVLAAALPRSPLQSHHRAGVLDRCDAELLTPRGLRTLAPADPDYQPRYRGDVVARDTAYHQGTVWPWLLGSYVELALRVRGPAARPSLRALLDGFADELDRAGLDHVSEVFDGDPPHQPGGTIAQAWNTGELLRAYALLTEDL